MIRPLAAAMTLLAVVLVPVHAAQFTLEKDDQGVTVKCDGQLFTRYWQKSGSKPILWPVVGPSGKELTRGYPMREALDTEKRDHVHHRSLWFVHGDVNGISFWDESDPSKNGSVEHQQYLKLQEGEQAVIQTANSWKTPQGEVLCQDVRTMTFGASGDQRWIDFQVRVTAHDQQVVFGDTKEGSFAVRVAGSMKVDQKLGGKIVNSEGQTDGQAWGQRASWVDYTGPVDGDIVGIAILNHPRSLRYPTYWHVRTYGLFAANPFGVRDFTGDETANGALTLAAGESFEMFFRIILHQGETDPTAIHKAFEDYAAQAVGQ